MESLECNNIIEQSWYDKNVLLEVNQNRVATLRLNRSAKHNALNSEMLIALNNAFDYLEEYHSENNTNVRVLLLRANGKSFCAGADLNSMQKTIDYNYDENYQDALVLARVLERLSNFACPTIAVVQGDAYGGGVGLICAADFAIALDGANFSLSEVKLGLIPAVISPYLVATMGYKQAMRFVLSANKFDAQTALNLNILSQIVNSELSLNAELKKLVSIMLNNGPLAMQKAKLLIKEVHEHRDSNIISKTAEAIASIRVSQEAQEGLLAFINKRQPNWVINNKLK